jgi:eukaryotic-like serine/threonine-protein kinase
MLKKLGKFEVIEKVGQGAMGVVYKARDPFIDRIVALKTLTTGLAEDPNLLKRFYSEARSAGGLQHPNIVTIYELGHESSTPYIAMQFLNGESLDKIVDRRPDLPLAQKVGFIVYVCRALEYAHKQNPPVVHRDIKPGNVMLTTDGAVMVVDFGIARLGEGTRSQSAGMLIGTLGYMSPQLFRNSAADARSDIWATGVMFYEILAYRRPFDGDNAAALMSSIILDKPVSLSISAPGTPEDVQAVVERMLAKEAEARYQSMEEVLLELEPIWQRLRKAEVIDLLADGEKLLQTGNLENAKAKISQVMQIDTANLQAKSLLEKINAEFRRRQIGPQIKERVEKAEQLFAGGQLESAKALLQEALKLDTAFQPAKEALAKVEAAEERQRNITQGLRASKQRMAEGALTEAQEQLDKVLQLDPSNSAAQEQRKQIHEERSRRERRKQRDETLNKARTLWTNLQYEECVQLVTEALKQFPGDTELIKLLENARQDQAEQRKQAMLTAARNMLNAQKFDEALRTLDRLQEQYPADSTIKNLRVHAAEGQDQKAKDERLEHSKARLRELVKEAKYEEVLRQAAQLSREFPDDFELTEMLDFARAEQAQLEQKRRLETVTKQIRQMVKDGKFSEALVASDKALLEFPKNMDLMILQDRARKEKEEKEKHELLKQRLREVERFIDKQQITDAIDLARQTLTTVGQDSRIADTLRKAEKELEFREKKKKKEEAEAAAKKETAAKAEASAKAKAKKEPPAPAGGSGVGSDPTLIISPAAPKADPGKDYVYQRGTPLPPETISLTSDTNIPAFSATIVTGPTVQPLPGPVVTPKVTAPSTPPAPVEVEKPAVEPREAKPQAKHEEVEPVTQTASKPVWKNPIAIGALALVLAGAGGYALFHSNSPANTTTTASHEDQTLWNSAEQAMNASPRHLSEALSKFENLEKNKSFESKAQARIQEIQNLQKQENDFMEQAAQAQEAKNYDQAIKEYQQARDINGDRAKDAEDAINFTNRLKNEDPAKLAQEVFGQAEQLFAQRDWARAKSSYQQVISTREAPANLRTKASEKLTIASNHAEEDALWKQAQDAYQAKQFAAAKDLAQRVEAKRLDHAADAQNLIRSVDTELKSAGDEQVYADLRREVDEAKSANNRSALESLQGQAKKLASANGKHAAEEGQIADNEIPAFLKKAESEDKNKQLTSEVLGLAENGRYRDAMTRTSGSSDPSSLQKQVQDSESKALQALQDNYKSVDKKNEADLKALQTKVQQFESNANNSQPAQTLLTSIANDLNAAKPPAAPAATPSAPVQPTAAADTKAGVRAAIDQLNHAFADHKVDEIKGVWTSMTRKDADTLKSSFTDAKLSMSFTLGDITLNAAGDTAVVTGSRASSYQEGKEKKSANGPFKATLKKQGDRWIVSELNM